MHVKCNAYRAIRVNIKKYCTLDAEIFKKAEIFLSSHNFVNVMKNINLK